MQFLYYNPIVATAPSVRHLPGMRRFALYNTKIGSGAGVMFLDRTKSVMTPLCMASIFPIPAMQAFSPTLEEVCNARARELLARMERLGVRMYVLYSGGIDSTLMLVSLLKEATVAQKAQITVLLSEESIRENPNFFRDHIRGKLTIEASTMFNYLLGTKALLVSAELNDIIFGSDFVRPFMRRFGLQGVQAPYNLDTVFDFIRTRIGDGPTADEDARRYLELFERINAKAPMPLTSHFDVFWWITFCLKWQFISVRMLALTPDRHAHLITKEYVNDYFSHFFDTEDFQRWSMHNLDKKIKDDWKTYKWPCKEIIYEYNKDAEYRDNKTKKGSLALLVNQQNPFHFVDENYGLHRNLPPEEYTQPENDFV